MTLQEVGYKELPPFIRNHSVEHNKTYEAKIVIAQEINDVTFDWCLLKAVKFDSSTLNKIQLEDCSMENTVFEVCSLNDWAIACAFKEVKFIDSCIEAGKMEDTVFDYCNFTEGTSFNNCRFKDVLFNNCFFRHNTFSNCWFENVEFKNCTFSGSQDILRPELDNQVVFDKCVAARKVQFNLCRFNKRLNRGGVFVQGNEKYSTVFRGGSISVLFNDCTTDGLDTYNLDGCIFDTTSSNKDTVKEPVKDNQAFAAALDASKTNSIYDDEDYWETYPYIGPTTYEDNSKEDKKIYGYRFFSAGLKELQTV